MRDESLFLKDKSRVTAMEYALNASLIALSAIGAFTLVGINLINLFITIANKL